MKLDWERAWSRGVGEVGPRIYGAHHGVIFLGSEVSVRGHMSQNSSVCYPFNMETGEPAATRRFEPGWTVLGMTAVVGAGRASVVVTFVDKKPRLNHLPPSIQRSLVGVELFQPLGNGTRFAPEFRKNPQQAMEIQSV